MAGNVPGVSAGDGQGPNRTMEVPTLTIVCREGPRPADDIFLYGGAGIGGEQQGVVGVVPAQRVSFTFARSKTPLIDRWIEGKHAQPEPKFNRTLPRRGLLAA